MSICSGTTVGAPIDSSLIAAGRTTGSAYRRSSVKRGSTAVISTSTSVPVIVRGSRTVLTPAASAGGTATSTDVAPAVTRRPVIGE